MSHQCYTQDTFGSEHRSLSSSESSSPELQSLDLHLRGSALRGKILYGEQVGKDKNICLKRVDPPTHFVQSSKELHLKATKCSNAWRSEDTKRSNGFIKWELERERLSKRQLNAYEKSRKCWFSRLGDNAEFVLIPADSSRCANLGDCVALIEPFYICQASSFGGDRFCLVTRDDKPHLVKFENPTNADVISEEEEKSRLWYLTDIDFPNHRTQATLLHTVALKSYSGFQLIVERNDPDVSNSKTGTYSLQLTKNLPTSIELLGPNCFWHVKPVNTVTVPTWLDHCTSDAMQCLPVERFSPNLFETNSLFKEGYHDIIRDDRGRIDLGAQEVLLVEDILHCLIGVSGEFIELQSRYPLLHEHDCDPSKPKPLPVFDHKYCTYIQRYKDNPPKERIEMRLDDFDDPNALDESLRAMSDKIMHIVHQVSMIRHSADYHQSLLLPRTNQALGFAMKTILNELDMVTTDLDGNTSEHGTTLSLQKLWSILHGAQLSLNLLTTVATDTYGIEGIRLINILYRIRAEIASNETQKCMATFLIAATTQPLNDMLTKWLFSGTLEDPWGEFFIISNPRLGTPETQIQKWLFWEHKFCLAEDRVPDSLKPFSEIIVETGKAWNIMLGSCGSSNESKLDAARYHEDIIMDSSGLASCILRAHDFIMDRLFELMKTEGQILARLVSMQEFFFIKKSDLFIDFCDSALSELVLINPHIDRLRDCWTKALNWSVLRNDPFKDQYDISCSAISLKTLTKWADPIWSTEVLQVSAHNTTSASKDRSFKAPKVDTQRFRLRCTIGGFLAATGLHTANVDKPLVEFCDNANMECDGGGTNSGQWRGWMAGKDSEVHLSGYECVTHFVNIRWPLHLILSMESCLAYQTIFRLLFQCEFVQRQLALLWKSVFRLQKIQQARTCSSFLVLNCLNVRHEMAQYLTNMVTYVTEEVLEPRSKAFNEAAKTEKSIKGLKELHTRFIATCQYEIFFTQSEVFRTIITLIEICRQFVDFASQLLILPELCDEFNSYKMQESLKLGSSSITLADKISATKLDSIENLQLIRSLRRRFRTNYNNLVDSLILLSRTAYGAHTKQLLGRLDPYTAKRCVRRFSEAGLQVLDRAVKCDQATDDAGGRLHSGVY